MVVLRIRLVHRAWPLFRAAGHAGFRRGQPAGADARLTRDQAIFVIRDEGPGFDPRCLPDPLDPECFDKAGGRGILLMRTFMNEVQFNSTGNQVTLVKRRSHSSSGDGESLKLQE